MALATEAKALFVWSCFGRNLGRGLGGEWFEDPFPMVSELLISVLGCLRVSGVSGGSRERGEIKGGRVGMVGELTVEIRNVDA